MNFYHFITSYFKFTKKKKLYKNISKHFYIAAPSVFSFEVHRLAKIIKFLKSTKEINSWPQKYTKLATLTIEELKLVTFSLSLEDHELMIEVQMVPQLQCVCTNISSSSSFEVPKIRNDEVIKTGDFLFKIEINPIILKI